MLKRFGVLARNFHSSPLSLAKKPFLLADIGEGISEVEIIQWFVKAGDKVEEFDRLCEVQSDKAAVEISSRFTGEITKLYYASGDIAKVGAPLIEIDTVEDEAEATESTVADNESKETIKSPSFSAPSSSTKNNNTNAKTFATPAVRRIAKENGIDISLVTGTGPGGRVLKGDILAFIGGESKPAEKPSNTATGINAAKTVPGSQSETTVALTQIQKAMFKSMTKSLQIPHFGFSDDIDIGKAAEMRTQINSYLKSQQTGLKKISFMPIFLKTISIALSEFPILNAKVAEENGVPVLKYRSAHNIGIAMDTSLGLIVPNVKNVESKSILEIAQDLEELKVKGANGGLTNADLSGGTFTLSNVGNIGGTLLHPVLVTSEVCIGALGKVRRVPAFDENDNIIAKEILTCSFNADHRVIDGATVARFVQKWKSLLENPNLLTASLK